MELHDDNFGLKYESKSLHSCFGWITFVFFTLVLIISPFIFIPPFISQDFKKVMIGIHSFFSFCTLFWAIMTMMTGDVISYDYIVP